jgi:hypothetical protein
MFDRSNKVARKNSAIENIRRWGNVVAFNKIPCNEQEKLPRVLRALRRSGAVKLLR